MLDFNNKYNNYINYLIIFISFVAIFVYFSTFIVSETQVSFVTQFGKIIKKQNQPGLHFKLPIIQHVNFVDKRIAQVNSPTHEVISMDRKRIIVNAHTKYRIIDPSIFYISFKNTENAEKKIMAILDSSLRRVIASHMFSDLLSDQRSQVMNEIEEQIKTKLYGFGIEIIDVRLLNTSLPESNKAAIFSRMRAEREQESNELRAKGEEEALLITANADKTAKTIIADANKQKNIIIGNAKARSAELYNKSAANNYEFFKFYKNINAYEGVLDAENNSTIVLTTSADIFKLLKTKN